MVFAVVLKWVVKRLQQRPCLAFTQFLPRLVAPPPSLIAGAISAMSILYQRWRLCVGLLSIVSAQGAKTNTSHLISNVSESMLVLVSLYLENSPSATRLGINYVICNEFS